MGPLLGFLLGTLQIRISGRMPERLINLCLRHDLTLWNLHRRSDGLYAEMRPADIFRIRPLARKAGCRLRIVNRSGLPILWRRVRGRRVLIGSALAVWIGLWVFSNFVWFIEVEGHDRLEEADILAAAAQAGLRPGTWKFAVHEATVVRELLLRLPDLAWADLTIAGTKATIQVVERIPPPVLEPSVPGDLIAARAGVVEEIRVVQGEPVVRVGQTVRAGEILVRGWIHPWDPAAVPPPDVGETPQAKPVRARGAVIARTWHEGYLEVPLVERTPLRTGRQSIRRWLEIGDARWLLSGPRRPLFSHYEREKKTTFLPPWGGAGTAFRLVEEIHYEIAYETKRRRPAEAYRRAKEILQRGLLDQIGLEARIASIQTEPVDVVGEVVALYMKIETRENIARFSPHSPTDSAP